MNIENVEFFGLNESIKASKYPMSVDNSKCTDEITKTVINLATCDKGAGHDNFLNGIIVQFDLTFSIKAWVELQRYHFIDFVSSNSTMHRICKMNIEEQCNKYVTDMAKNNILSLIGEYNVDNTPENYLKVLYNIPTGFELTARMTTNYRQLKTIYSQRKSHRLPDWNYFCEWIETLPHSEFIIGVK